MNEEHSSAQPRDEPTEEKYLEQQAADAKAAILATLRDLFDARAHIRHHPWLSVGVAGIAGVAAGSAIGRKRVNEGSKTPPAQSTMSPILKTIVGEAIKFAIPTLFTGAVLAKTDEQIDQATGV